MPCELQSVAQLISEGAIELTHGFAITPEWSLTFGDEDEEFLEDQILEYAGQNSLVVIVANIAAQVTVSDSGKVQVNEVLRLGQVKAFFAKSDPQDGEFSWFGPTEKENLLHFLGDLASTTSTQVDRVPKDS